jgi:DNA-binding GntR family transcriptional regulator
MTAPDEAYLRTGDHIFRLLRQQIVSNEIPPNSRLVEEDIADQFGVSRSPVREALRRLEQDGLIRRLRRGMLVSVGVSQEELYELHLLRTEIDCVAAGLVCERGPARPWSLAETAIADLESDLVAHGMRSPRFAIRHLEVHTAINQICFSAKVAPVFPERLGGLLTVLEADCSPTTHRNS